MEKEEKISIEVDKPAFPIGQVVYVPIKNQIIETRILGYEIQAFKEEGTLLGVVSNYRIQHFVPVRRGEESDLVGYVKECDFYVNKSKAGEASKFLEVKADEESWKLAVGDRKVEDKNSPYNTENCGLPICCANISEARDILLYCKNEGGLIVHERDLLRDLIVGHDLEYKGDSPIGKIFAQLGI